MRITLRLKGVETDTVTLDFCLVAHLAGVGLFGARDPTVVIRMSRLRQQGPASPKIRLMPIRRSDVFFADVSCAHRTQGKNLCKNYAMHPAGYGFTPALTAV